MTATDHDGLQTIRALDPTAFEQFVADLWEAQGWNTTVSRASGDEGIDVVATRRYPHRQKALIQAKRYQADNTVGAPEIQQYGSLYQQEDDVDQVVVVTTSSFTRDAEARAADLDVDLVDGRRLLELLGRHDPDGELLSAYREGRPPGGIDADPEPGGFHPAVYDLATGRPWGVLAGIAMAVVGAASTAVGLETVAEVALVCTLVLTGGIARDYRRIWLAGRLSGRDWLGRKNGWWKYAVAVFGVLIVVNSVTVGASPLLPLFGWWIAVGLYYRRVRASVFDDEAVREAVASRQFPSPGDAQDALAADDAETRRAAARALNAAVRERPHEVVPAVDALADRLTDADETVRRLAVATLRELAGQFPEHVHGHERALAARLADEPGIDTAALRALAGVAEAYPDAVTDATADADGGLRTDDPDHVDAHLEMVAAVAARRPARAAPVVESRLDLVGGDHDADVRRSAARFVEDLCDVDLGGVLSDHVEHLGRAATATDDPAIRAPLLRTLYALADDAPAAHASYLDAYRELAGADDGGVVAAALANLAAATRVRPGDVTVDTSLVTHLSSGNSDVRKRAAELFAALSEARPDDLTRAVPSLAGIAESESGDPARHAARALRNVSEADAPPVASAVAPIVAATDSVGDAARSDLLWALANVAAARPGAVADWEDDVARYASSESPAVREPAERALEHLATHSS